jgi:hypothetical protein
MSESSGASPLEFLKSANPGFGELGSDADSVHGNPKTDHHSATETYWFEVLVPRARLVAHFYIFMRPNLSICHAGGWMHRGFCNDAFLMDHFNYQAALPFPNVDGNTVSVPEVGLKLTIVDPLRELAIEYRPPGSKDFAQLRATAAIPPAVRQTGMHFNQFMHYVGTIGIDGVEIAVDDISIRDRSWGEPRLEAPLLAPVTSWASGYFPSAGTAFNFIGFDDPDRGAEWKGVYGIPSDKTLMDGWYFQDGGFTKLVRMSKVSARDPSNRMAPRRVEAILDDARGRQHKVIGTPLAACCMSPWPNIHTWLPLMQWDLDGVQGIGDCQEYSWTDYARRYWR